ncbi:MAG: type ISP restriction/modification enzyme, partial [Actinomycetota bacterium]|nr:type ISP restriction/modification enzyme [Actinomycetota bacterium]
STSASSDEVLRQHPELTGTGRISWNRSLRQRLDRGHDLVPDAQSVRRGSYRPFAPQWVYFDAATSDMMYRLPSMFPTPHHRNYGIYQVGNGSSVPFSVLMIASIPDLHVTGAGSGGQFFPRFTYEQNNATAAGELDYGSPADDSEIDEYGYRRIDNITDDILAIYQATLGESVTKDQIFWSVYGQLHVPSYRSTYAADLKKMLPHIPVPDTVERFTKLAQAGEKLGNLHMRYEDVEPYPLDVQLKPGTDPADRETWRVQKMKWRSKTDHTAIIYNPKVTITGIPAGAEEYMLGSRSALAWIIDRYQVKTDKASGIVNDPNLWCDEQDDPTYIIDVIKKVTTISIETMRIVGEL